MTDTAALILRYYEAFNLGDVDTMLTCLSDDVVHGINQSGRVTGREPFRRFMDRMNRCYRERLTEVVVFTASDPTRAAAEYVVNGMYVATDAGLPPARGQTYVLPGGAFFTVKDGKITRVANYYNLQDWLRQVQ
jgi:steroid delta-isomerase-like uncharacterized protein